MTRHTFERIAEYLLRSDVPRKERKLDGLRAAYRKQVPLALTDDDLLLHDGVAIDASELENGHWL